MQALCFCGICDLCILQLSSWQGETAEMEGTKDLFEDNFKELQKWVDTKSLKYGTLLVLRERRRGRLGAALKVISSSLCHVCC
jgi:tripeptidyl-peptidase-2